MILLGSPRDSGGQERLPADVVPPPRIADSTVVVTPGARYRAGDLHRFFLGSLHRDLWTTPVEVPVLDPGSFRGGLRPVRRGGGFQTLTLHMRDAEGRYYLFRSLDKRVQEALPPDLRRTPAGWVLQDQTSALHPAGAWVVAPLLDAVGVPHTAPRLYIMPDHPVLGTEYRDFAGRTGALLESPDDGPDGNLSFQGSSQVLGSDDWMEVFASSPAHRVDAASILKARLVDLLVGDPDRGYRQWRWLRYGEPGAWTWRGLPMDRDAAFMVGDGVIGPVGRAVEPKFVRFGDDIELDALIYDQPELDRLLLSELDRRTWDSVAVHVHEALTDSVLDHAVAAMPAGYREVGGEFLARNLRARRDQLLERSREYYGRLAREVDVQATEADEMALVEIRPDGTVDVSLHGPRKGSEITLEGVDGKELAPYFHRRFQPEETREVRVYLRGGDDRAVVRGASSSITVRVIAGTGHDVLADSTLAGLGGGGGVAFYAEPGDRAIAGSSTRVDTRSWPLPPVTAYRVAEGDSLVRDYGEPDHSWGYVVGWESDAGPVVGVARSRTTYGFRRFPWASKAKISGAVGLENRGSMFAAEGWRRLEGARVTVGAEASASRDLTGRRFYGLGNRTERISSDRALVLGDEVTLAAEAHLGDADRPWLAVGPRLRYVDPSYPSGAPIGQAGIPGSEPFGQMGVEARSEVRVGDPDERGRLDVSARIGAYPPVWDALGWFGGADLEVEGVLPVGGTLVGLRGGVRSALGDYPVHEAAYLGGGGSLRGFRSDRFAGDLATFAGVEWRVPVTRVTILTRGDLGVLGALDVGRVWYEGESPGGWHRGVGAGLWYRTLGFTGSAAYMWGEESRPYASLGVVF